MKNNNKKIKNVFLGHSIEEYKATYDIDKTIHIDKETINKFNKTHKEDPKDSPLDGRLWWLIGDTYYEVDSFNPKVNKHKKHKGPGFKIAMAGILGGICIGGVGAGGYIIVKKFKKDDNNERQIEIISEDSNVTFTKQTGENNELNIVLSCEDTTKEVYGVTVSIGNLELPIDDYLLNQATQTVIIPKNVLDNNVGNISVKVQLGSKINNHVKSISCPANFGIKVGTSTDFSSIKVTFNPTDPYSKELYITCDNSKVIIDNNSQTLSCNDEGAYKLTIRSKDNPNVAGITTLNVTKKVLTIEDSEGDWSSLMNFDINSTRNFVIKLDGQPVDITSSISSGPFNYERVSTGTYKITPTKEGGGGSCTLSFNLWDGGIEYSGGLEFEIASYNGLKVEIVTEGTYHIYASNASLSGDIYLPKRYYVNDNFVYISKIGTHSGSCEEDGFLNTKISSITIDANEGTGARNIHNIGKQTFYGCTSLAKINLTNQITTIDDLAFSCRTNGSASGVLTVINIGALDYLEKIGKWAFDGQKELGEILIPSRVTSIGQECFKDCNKLSYVRIDSSEIAKNYNKTCMLVNYATTLYISKQAVPNENEISQDLIEGFTKSTGPSDFWAYTKS